MQAEEGEGENSGVRGKQTDTKMERGRRETDLDDKTVEQCGQGHYSVINKEYSADLRYCDWTQQ